MGITFLTLKSEFTVAFLPEAVEQIASKARADLATLQAGAEVLLPATFLCGMGTTRWLC